MIRRIPTLIPMTDTDVQDVRDLVDKQKQAQTAHHQLMLKMKRLAASSNYTEEDHEIYEQLKASAAIALSAKAQSKAQRIGLQPDATSSTSKTTS